MRPLILVTGATGYIASRLIPRLLERGYRVRALARQPEKLGRRSWFPHVEMVQGDVTTPSTLARAFEGVEVAYYLIHNMSSGHGYTEIELQAAKNFANAAEAAGARHVIYLGGLADESKYIALHMRSRIETGITLRQGKVPVTEFRAGVIAGSGSISFEMIRFMTELCPIIPAPIWIKNKSQPISTQNVIDYLLAALDNHDGEGRVFEIGGPQVTTYRELMLEYARVRGHKRGFLVLPYVPLWFMALGIGLTTPVPGPIAWALVGGLSSDSVVTQRGARETFPDVKLIDFESATKEALTHLHPHKVEHIWDDDERPVKIIRHEGFFIDHRKIKVDTDPEKIFDAIKKFAKGFEARGFVTETLEPGCLLLLRCQLATPGEGWVEWRMGRASNKTYLTQTIFFAPRGLAGFLLWYLSRPLRAFAFYKLMKALYRA
jgi:uncharacterized protein YbjT (DUF2867 family)